MGLDPNPTHSLGHRQSPWELSPGNWNRIDHHSPGLCSQEPFRFADMVNCVELVLLMSKTVLCYPQSSISGRSNYDAGRCQLPHVTTTSPSPRQHGVRTIR